MQKTMEGIVEADGRIKLLGPSDLSPSQRVSVTAVDHNEAEGERRQDDWRAALRQARGMWKDRDDIPELMAQLRRESNDRVRRNWHNHHSGLQPAAGSALKDGAICKQQKSN